MQLFYFTSENCWLLTKNSSNGVPAVSFQVEEGWHSHDKLVQEAAKGPQVRLPTVLLLEEELGW